MEETPVAVVDTPTKPEVQPDGTPGTYGRVWLDGKQVRRKTYDRATGATPSVTAPILTGDTPSDTLAEFASLAKLLAEAGDNKRRRDEAIDMMETALARIQPEDAATMANHPTVLKFLGMVNERRVEKGVQPGEITGDGLMRQKMPWRKEDMTPDKFEYVVYTPNENCDVTWNGITEHFLEGVPTYMPKVFLDVYMDSKLRTRGANEHRALLFASRAKRDAGADNAVPSDPSLLVGNQGARSRQLRGSWAGGMFEPGAGLALAVPDEDRPGVEELEGGDGGQQ